MIYIISLEQKTPTQKRMYIASTVNVPHQYERGTRCLKCHAFEIEAHDISIMNVAFRYSLKEVDS